MAKPRKVPYYKMESSFIPFTQVKWKEYFGSGGCVPLNTQKTVSMDRLLPGVAPPPKPPKPTREQVKAQKAEEEQQKLLAKQQSKDKPKEKAPEPVDEECENPPVFDMLDIPDAMEKIKWPVSAKLARKWFNGEKHIYNDKPTSIQSIDDSTVTLDWALKFGSVKRKFNELLAEAVHAEKAVGEAKQKVIKKIHEAFFNQNSTSLGFDTAPFIGDPRQFHIDWQFQHAKISTWNTLTAGLASTDLTGSLGDFAICAAIGKVIVYGDKYFKYDGVQGTKTYCLDPHVQITHVYVYIKDNYSFNDEKGSRKSQYLGHWNKSGFIVTAGGFISDLVDDRKISEEWRIPIHSDLGNSPKDSINWVYLTSNELPKPVDIRRGMFRKFMEQDVYFPIYNKSYREWRERHNRGGDFMIYSKPKYMKLKKPIEFNLETLCRHPEKI